MWSEYRLRRRVQFHETDLAGFVHFSWFFRYMEEAEHAMWREAGLTISDPQSDIAWPRLSASFDYHRPLRFEDEFDVWLRIVEMTSRTIRYGCELGRGETHLATGSLTIICVSKGSTPMRAIDIPAGIASRFKVATPTEP
jgi:YbgC/YbaW family acyl-CoA thioester hydrolase